MRSLLTALVWIVGLVGMNPIWAQETEPKDRGQTIQAQIRENDLDAALTTLEDAKQAKADVSIAIRQELAMALLRANRTEECAKQGAEILNETFLTLTDEGNPAPFIRAYPLASVALIRNSESGAAEEWLNKAIAALESKLSSSEFTQNHLQFSELLKERLRRLDDKEMLAKGLERLREHIGRSEQLFADDAPNDTSAATMILLWNAGIQSVESEPAHAYFEKANALATARLKLGPTLPVLQAYASSINAMVAGHGRADPERAAVALSSAKELLGGLDASDQPIASTLENLRKSMERLDKIVEGSRALLAMVGQPAPAWEPMEWVHGEPETQDGLHGKVVLLDFWAVWCGPCIATFPHLKHWSEEYGPRGLTIIGVTRPYNYTWDEETQSAKRSEEVVAIEDEMAMLEKFMASHELKHRSMITPKQSEMQANYQVTGIPHAVLVDKLGKVRMVKIGSGEKNASDIEAMIQKLLDE